MTYTPSHSNLYTKFTKGKKLISATPCGIVLQHPYLVYCKFNVDPKYKDPLSDYQKLLFERGIEHETKVVKKKYPGIEPVEYETMEEGFKIVLNLMSQGAKAIPSAPVFLLPEGLYGEADILVKDTSHKSVFGPYHYKVQEIKVAKNIKKKHILQAAFYNYIIGKIQGYTPKTFQVINRDYEIHIYEYKDYEKELQEAIKLAKEIARGKEFSPTYNSDYPWNEYSKKMAIKANDISLIGGLGQSSKDKLNTAGFTKVQQIAKADQTELEKIKGIGKKTAHNFIRSAQAIITKKPIIIKKPEFKEYKTEIFLDLEGTDDPGDREGLIQIDYLIGIVVREKNKSKYIPFLAEGVDKEYQIWYEFLKFLKTKKDWIIYHWHNYERKHIKQLIERHGCPKAIQKLLDTRMIDLYKVATNSVYFPTYANSLKDIGPFCGFKWRRKDVDAMGSIALYLEFTETKNKKKLQKVIDYNEDDCLATMKIKDWLSDIS